MFGPYVKLCRSSFLVFRAYGYEPSLKYSKGMQSNRFKTASLVLAPPFLCISLIRVWKSSLIISPSNTMDSDIWSSIESNCSTIRGKFNNSLPFLENILTSSLSTSHVVITLTPSNLGSTYTSPVIFFSCFLLSSAHIHSNTGTFMVLCLLTVLCVTPHLRSLIKILLYQSFHSSMLDLSHRSWIVSRISFPVKVLDSNCLKTSSNSVCVMPVPSFLLVGTFWTPKVLKPSKADPTPLKNLVFSASLSRLMIASFFSLELSASSSCIIFHGCILYHLH